MYTKYIWGGWVWKGERGGESCFWVMFLGRLPGILVDTVDGSEIPNNHLGCKKTCK